MIYKAITNARYPYGRNESTLRVLILNRPGMGEVISTPPE